MTNIELKQLRAKNGLKQSDIAELLGIKQSYVSDMENDKKPISKQTESILIQKYGVQTVDLTNQNINNKITSLDIALKIIQQQSDSLAIKDEQITRLISLLENKIIK